MNKLLKKLNKSRSLSVAAFLISMSYLLSRILGLVRDRMLASNFGVSTQTDAYTAAFRIPDLLFTLLVSGAFAVSFIPVFIGFLEKNKQEQAWHLASTLLNVLATATLILSVIAMIFAPELVRMLVPGFDSERFSLTVTLTRILLITPILFSISAVLGAVQQAFNRFLLFSLASVFYNVGIIIGIVFFSKVTPGDPINGVAWGVVFGTSLQMLLQFFGIIGLGFKYKFTFDFWNKSVVKVIKLMIPRSIDLAIDQINWILQTVISSRLAVGSLSSYYYANNLKNVPLGIFGMAISTAVFPSLIRAAKSKDKSKLPRAFVRDMSLIIFFVVPSAAFAIVMRGYIVRLLFGFGDQATADTLGWLAGSIIATSLYFMIARVFYALEDTLTPLLTSLGAIIVNVVLSYILSAKYGVSGLGMALTISTTFECILTIILLRRKAGPLGIRSILATLLKVSAASLIMAMSLYLIITRWLPLYSTDVGFIAIAPKFIFLSVVGLVVYFAIGKIIKIQQTTTIMKKAMHPAHVIRKAIGN